MMRRFRGECGYSRSRADDGPPKYVNIALGNNRNSASVGRNSPSGESLAVGTVFIAQQESELAAMKEDTKLQQDLLTLLTEKIKSNNKKTRALKRHEIEEIEGLKLAETEANLKAEMATLKVKLMRAQLKESEGRDDELSEASPQKSAQSMFNKKSSKAMMTIKDDDEEARDRALGAAHEKRNAASTKEVTEEKMAKAKSKQEKEENESKAAMENLKAALKQVEEAKLKGFKAKKVAAKELELALERLELAS
ncbi:hypothetical protein ACHAWF_015786 [Thalassiosira exigua]